MNEKDIFKEQLKSVFRDFEAPVPHDGWAKMEQALNAAARAKIVRRNWYIGSAAAVAALLLGSLFFLRTPRTAEQNLPAFVESAPQKTENAGKQETQLSQKQTIEEPAATKKHQPIKKYDNPLFAKHTEKASELPVVEKPTEQAPEKIVIAQQTETKKEPLTEEPKTRQEEKRVSQPSQEEIDRLVREFANAGNTDILSGFESKEKKNPIMLAVNARGGLTSSQKTVNSPMTLRSASVNKSNNANNGMLSGIEKNDILGSYSNSSYSTRNIADNIAEMEHAQPLSVGFTVSKTIIDRLSVETGLVYTYLFSKVKNTNIDFSNQETQHFHYLGIPVNVNYNFLNIGRLGLFTSLGGMVEKDIHGELRLVRQSFESEMNKGSEIVSTTKINQKNPQFSVNVGIGAYYPIYGGFNLYGKVGGSYYFDAKNEYKTIYSDKKIVLDLNAGIRFDF